MERTENGIDLIYPYSDNRLLGFFVLKGCKISQEKMPTFRPWKNVRKHKRWWKKEPFILKMGSAAVKYNDLGLQKYLQVEFDDAIADYTKAIELDPDFAVAYFNRGTVFYRLGYYEMALKDLVKSVNLEPKNPEFVEALTDCRKMLEEEENAGS